MRYGGCDCGATDCPSCTPGCNEPVECCVCGEFHPAHSTLGTGCASCRGDIGEACESALVETPIGRMCPDCAMEWNGRGAT